MPELPSVDEIEAACLSAWPAIKTAYDGRWVWRFAKGYTKRSNSVQSIDRSDDRNADFRLKRMLSLFERNGIPPIFRVTPLAGPGIIAALDANGWQIFEESWVLALPLDGTGFDHQEDVRLIDPANPEWYLALAALSGYPPDRTATLRMLLDLIPWDAKGVVAYERGTPLATALAINAGGIGVYVSVVTSKEHRRRGHGRKVMQAALAWTKSAGARVAAIQVVSDNFPALELYELLGFVDRYRYHYRRLGG